MTDSAAKDVILFVPPVLILLAMIGASLVMLLALFGGSALRSVGRSSGALATTGLVLLVLAALVLWSKSVSVVDSRETVETGGSPAAAHSLANVPARGAADSDAPAPAEDGRPDWVTAPAQRIGNVYRTTVRSDPFATLEECYDDVDVHVERVAARYADEVLDKGAGKQLRLPASYVRRHAAREEWVETVDSPSLRDLQAGPVYRVHVLLEFGTELRGDMESQWRDLVHGQRRNAVLKVAAAVLVCLGTLLAYLKLDTATRGFYTRRLQLTALAVILIVFALLR